MSRRIALRSTIDPLGATPGQDWIISPALDKTWAVSRAWPKLPKHVRETITALAKSATEADHQIPQTEESHE